MNQKKKFKIILFVFFSLVFMLIFSTFFILNLDSYNGLFSDALDNQNSHQTLRNYSTSYTLPQLFAVFQKKLYDDSIINKRWVIIDRGDFQNRIDNEWGRDFFHFQDGYGFLTYNFNENKKYLYLFDEFNNLISRNRIDSRFLESPNVTSNDISGQLFLWTNNYNEYLFFDTFGGEFYTISNINDISLLSVRASGDTFSGLCIQKVNNIEYLYDFETDIDNRLILENKRSMKIDNVSIARKHGNYDIALSVISYRYLNFMSIMKNRWNDVSLSLLNDNGQVIDEVFIPDFHCISDDFKYFAGNGIVGEVSIESGQISIHEVAPLIKGFYVNQIIANQDIILFGSKRKRQIPLIQKYKYSGYVMVL